MDDKYKKRRYAVRGRKGGVSSVLGRRFSTETTNLKKKYVGKKCQIP